MSKKPYLKLFVSTLTLSAFTFGGGYVIVPLMKKKFVEQLGWLEEDEMLELVAMAQSCPGAMAVNTATLVGYRMAGLPGALLGVLATIIPPLIILTLVCFFYEMIRDNTYVSAALKGMQAGIAAIIADVVFGMARPFFKRGKALSLCIMFAAFIAAWFLDVNVMYIIVACAALGAIGALISGRRTRKGGEEQ